MAATDASYGGGVTESKLACRGAHKLEFAQSFQYVPEERAGH